MRIDGISDIGKMREINQDRFDTVDLPDNAGLAVVCDGMGGPGGGQIASAIAVRTICTGIAGRYSAQMRLEDIKSMVKKSVQEANVAIFDEALANRKLMGMGTTLVMAFYRGRHVLIGNIGDSRAYLIKDGRIAQITKDHSMVQQMVDSGSITKREAKNHPQKNIITRALGVEASCDLDFFEVDLEEFDSILLCTDGLTNHVDDSELSFEISVGDKQKTILKRLVMMANERGGTDNITAVLISPSKI